MSNRPSYKKLYIEEKRRREFYEKLEPRLLVVWEKKQENMRQLAQDMEQAFIFGRGSMMMTAEGFKHIKIQDVVS